MTTNISPLAGSAQPTIDEAVAWIRILPERGLCTRDRATRQIHAIEQLTSVLADDEPRDVISFLAALDEVVKRYAIKSETPVPAGTQRAYKDRAQSGLRRYLKFLRDPRTLKPLTTKRSASTSKGDPKRPQSAHGKMGAQKQTAPEAAEAPPPAADMMHEHDVNSANRRLPTREFPIGNGSSTFQYALPTTGLSMSDVAKIFCHLMPFAKDFNPANPAHTRCFGIIPINEAEKL